MEGEEMEGRDGEGESRGLTPPLLFRVSFLLKQKERRLEKEMR